MSSKTIVVNGVEVPAPESSPPEDFCFYYVPEPSSTKIHKEAQWISDCIDFRWLEDGLVYLVKENAIKRAEAMLKHEEENKKMPFYPVYGDFLSQVLMQAFAWEDTPQGESYWVAICQSIEGVENESICSARTPHELIGFILACRELDYNIRLEAAEKLSSIAHLFYIKSDKSEPAIACRKFSEGDIVEHKPTGCRFKVDSKPQTIRIGDRDVPKPVSGPLDCGKQYFYPELMLPMRVGTNFWDDDTTDLDLLFLGVIHETREAAEEHARALVEVSGGTPDF